MPQSYFGATGANPPFGTSSSSSLPGALGAIPAGGERSGTYFSDPNTVANLTGTLSGQATNAANMWNQFVQNPAGSDLFQKQLAGLLMNPNLVRSRQQAVTGLGDQFRAAGNMSSGAFANAAARQQGDFNAQDQSTAAQLLGTLFPQVANALQQPQNLAAQLMSVLKMQAAGRNPAAPQSAGGGGGGSQPQPTGMAGWAGGSGGTNTPWSTQQPDPWQATGYGPDGTMTLQQATAYYSSQFPGSTYLGANGDFMSGTSNGSTPWTPSQNSTVQGQLPWQPAQWSFQNDPQGVAGDAQDWQSLYGNADGSMSY